MASKKKKKKPLRGVIPGSSKFSRITAHVLAGNCKPPPLASRSDGSGSPLASPVDLSGLDPSSSGSHRPDLLSVDTSVSVPFTDLNFKSVLALAPSVEGSSSGEAGLGDSVLVDGSIPSSVVADQKLASDGSSPIIVVGSSSDVANKNDSPSTTVAGSPSGEVNPPHVRKYSTVARDSSCLEEIGSPTQHISGVPFVFIPDENIQAAKVEFKDFIYAQFHGPPPAMGRVIGVVNAIWARAGPRIFVHRIGDGTFLLKVTTARVRDNILSRNMWNIVGHPMFVAPWSPDFNPDTPPISSAIVTVELRGVPYLLFNKESLGRIATAVGKPVALAPETARKENFEVAKILVRVNLLKELPTRVVSGFSDGREIDIEVSYPWLPPKCSTCDQFGHVSSLCNRKTPSTSGRKVATRSSSRRGRPSRRERLSRKSSQSRSGRSRTVAHTRVLSSPENVKDDAPEVNVVDNSSLVVVAERDLKFISPAAASCSNVEKEVESPFIMVTRRKSGRKAASLH